MDLLEQAMIYKKQGEMFLRNGDYKTARQYFINALNTLYMLKARAPKELKSIWQKAIDNLIDNINKIDLILSGGNLSESMGDVKLGVGFKEILTKIKEAKEIIRIASPLISKSIFRRIVSYTIPRNIELFVMLRPLSHNDDIATLKSFEYILSMQNKYPDLIHVKFIPNLHAKMIIIDDSILIIGSMNLTTTGMMNNVEFVLSIDNPSRVLRAIQQFDDLWMKTS